MQNKRRWAEDSFFKREKNIKESNYDDYLNEERKILWKYLNRRRKDKAKLYMRKSGSDYLSSKYISLIKNLFLTTLFAPE